MQVVESNYNELCVEVVYYDDWMHERMWKSNYNELCLEYFY